MMAEKARMFGDRDMLGNIMEAREPKAMKAYGRAVKNFDKETWDAACYEPVSYTHLDVYKRQGWSIACTWM